MSTVERSTGHGSSVAGAVGVGHGLAGQSVVARAGDPPIEHERPEDWGWHHDFGWLARIAGWVCVVVLLITITATHYNNAGTAALLITAGLMVVGLLWDARRRRNAWRR